MAEQSVEAHSGEELLDCARYGELDDVVAILKSGVDVNFQDAHGNTALHRSCANGHADVVRTLISRGAKHLPNEAGNRPLQWAVQNTHVACVEALLELYPGSDQMNVLDKNGFGKSALTDAFVTGDAELVKMILNHKSAEEDMLLSQSSLGNGKGTQAHGEDAAEKGTADTMVPSDGAAEPSNAEKGTAASGEEGASERGPSVTHELGFGVADPENPDEGCIAFNIRELSIRDPDRCFGEDATKDTTGLCLWAAAVVLARWVASPELCERLEGQDVLELGAGCGAGGISAAVHGRPASVVLTDLNVETMANLRHNIELNRRRYPAGVEIRAATLDWEDESTWAASGPPCDVILGADIVYQSEVAPKLLHAILSLLKPGGTFFHVCPVTERDGLEEFLADLGVIDGKGGGEGGSGTFELLSAKDAPKEYRSNPLVSGSVGQYMLHFNELPRTTFQLLEFRKRA